MKHIHIVLHFFVGGDSVKNSYEIRGDVAVIFLNSHKYGPMETVISTNKFERAMNFTGTWGVQWEPKTQSFYCKGSLKSNGKYTTIRLHRRITNAPENMQVDHKNHDTLDNTNENLRIVTNAQNQQNRKGAPRSSSSRVRGVHWEKRRRKWRAYIYKNNKLIHLGYFDSISDAEKTVKSCRAKHMTHAIS